MKKIYLVPFFLLFTSCGFIIKNIAGISDPKIETLESLETFLGEYEIEIDSLYAVKDSVDFMYLFEEGGPDAYFYDKNGYFLDYRPNPESCNGAIIPFIQNLEQNIYQTPDSSKHINELMNKLVSLPKLKGAKFKEGYDVTIVMTWFKWMGRVGPEHLKDWISAIDVVKSNGVKVRCVFLNLDYHSHLGIEAKDIPRIKVS